MEATYVNTVESGVINGCVLEVSVLHLETDWPHVYFQIFFHFLL